LPASGKSFWSKQFIKDNPIWKIVNKDYLRLMVDDGKWSKQNEKVILSIRDSIIETILSSGFNVIVDDTNLSDNHYNHIKEKFKGVATVEIKDFTHVSLEECILRDSKRQNYVGEKVIRQMYNQYLRPEPVAPIYDFDLPDVVITDLDGTTALFGKDKNPFDRDFENDELNLAVARILDGRDVIFLSGRQEKFRKQTNEFLEKHNLPYLHLFMRKDGDQRKDSIIKKEIYENEIKGKYNILFVVDDRLSVSRQWFELGLPLFRYGDPDADF
jgi:predicted kinase